jgi:hypothetical protein
MAYTKLKIINLDENNITHHKLYKYQIIDFIDRSFFGRKQKTFFFSCTLGLLKLKRSKIDSYITSSYINLQEYIYQNKQEKYIEICYSIDFDKIYEYHKNVISKGREVVEWT